ncbi:uncharacterized protein LOC129779963 [Toxorhynchites rutilus septentrionalis]|uniref:uncharacterized protein LOC129779963 n=1 Tax=Toxorhynchites rutilus septentrionalis TaxID=329112 RepID=UPI00247A84BE|nr:uncharacterized protein LOC129779963 [Toxorhynchites rutilus septentrionalis]
MYSTRLFCVILFFLVATRSSSAFPILDYFNYDIAPSARDGEQPSATMMELSQYRSLLHFDTFIPVMKIILAPIGRMMQPMIEQWIEDYFGAYIDSIGRAVENISRFATDNISFQPGDTYYTKDDLLNGYGYNSLIINLPSGKTVTVLTHRSSSKLNILDEFPQLSEAFNEVRKLN